MEPMLQPDDEMPAALDEQRKTGRTALWFALAGAAALPLMIAAVPPRHPAFLILLPLGMAALAAGMILSLRAHRVLTGWLALVASFAGLAAYVVCLPICLTPVYSHQSKDLNNIRQLAVAAQMYAQDNGGLFPGWANDGTKASPRYVHNVWDQQIDYRLKIKDAYSDGTAGIRSPSQPGPNRNRVLTYGINGALLARWAGGEADFAAARAGHRPAPLGLETVSNPAGTILFAQLATKTPMDGVYGQPIPADRRPKSGGSDWAGTEAYQKAQPGWIDISPRAFCELTNPPANNYEAPYKGATGRGIARDLYGGGACFAFVDGHVQFMELARTVGIGQTVDGKPVTARNCWSPLNTYNMWNPNL